MLYLGILGNFMPIFLIFALSKINYARGLRKKDCRCSWPQKKSKR